MSTTHDFYDALGVGRDASDAEIKSAFRKLARKYHPDVNKAPDATQRFAEVTEAYEVLSDPEKRKAYDRFGHAGVRGEAGRWGPGGGGATVDVGDLGSIFDELFGGRSPFDPSRQSPFGGGAGRQPPPQRGGDVEHTVKITFLTSILGGEETVRIHGPEGVETITVRIPPGVETGGTLRVRGKGQRGSGGGPRGDLRVTVEVGRHPFYRRDGRNILVDLPLTFAEASLGTTVNVPLIHGGVVTLKVPPGTSSGRMLRVKGQGVRGGDTPDGDFLAVVQIVTPASLSTRARTLLEELSEELDNPRQGEPWED